MPLLAIIAPFLIWANVQTRQQMLDAALIEAIKRRQTRQAISLLNEGASGNALDIPRQPLTVQTFVSDVWATLNGTARSKVTYPSALTLACAVRMEAGMSRYLQPVPADVSLVRALLSHGANPNTSYIGKKSTYAVWDFPTPLDSQILAGETEAVKLLLEYGAQANRSTYPPPPPLLFAVAHNRVDVAKLLLEHGADARALTKNGASVLQMAAYERCIPMLDLLLSQGLNINARDKDGWTPLMDAIKARTNGPNNSARVSNRSVNAGTAVTVRFLLRHGADASIKNRKGQTALVFANSLPDPFDKKAVMRLLTEADAAKSRRH